MDKNIELNQPRGMGKTLKRWRAAKRDLCRRADDLQAKADKIRRENPAGAAVIMHRSIVLRDEANRMSKESKTGISTDKVRRSAALAEISLLIDKVKGK